MVSIARIRFDLFAKGCSVCDLGLCDADHILPAGQVPDNGIHWLDVPIFRRPSGASVP